MGSSFFYKKPGASLPVSGILKSAHGAEDAQFLLHLKSGEAKGWDGG